jgi:hypothetical protein
MGRLSVEERMSPEYGGFASFVDNCLEFDSRLATPLRFMWRAYLNHCERYGFPKAEALAFQRYANAEPRINLKSHGKAVGYIRSTVNGACVRPDRRAG